MRALPFAVLLLWLPCCYSSSDQEPSTSIHDAGDVGDAQQPNDTSEGGSVVPEAGASDWSFEILEARTVRSLERDVQVELIRVHQPGGARSYILYTHAPTANAPVVVAHEPYAGIDWSGEAIDARWVAQGNGLHPDVDAPDYDGDDVIAFELQSVQSAVDASAVWTINNFATVHTYARFYTGGSLAGDVLDAAAGFHFIASRSTELDAARIGSFGGSWGGMMALFGARNAPAAATPRAVAALTPLSDFVDQWQWTQFDLPASFPRPAEVEAFFSPYWRRAKGDLGDPPVQNTQSRPFTLEGLCPQLPGVVFAPHDDWDTLIPVRQTERLTSACDNVQPMYWRRSGAREVATTKLDHGTFDTEPQLPSMSTFAYTFMVSALANDAAPMLISLAHQPALEVYLGTVRAAQLGGQDPGAVLPRLRELAAPRVQLFSVPDNNVVAGGEMLAAAVNAVWGTSYDATTLRQQLANGLPPAP